MSSPGAPASPLDPIAAAALRKATWRLIPLIALGYGTAYMDRVNISFAALQMNRDLHFSNTVYGFGAGLFFLSYAACEIPSNLMLYRFGARRWLARIMVTWGLIAMAMIFVRTPMQFYAARFFLGMAEAGFFPGVIFYLMQWYPAAPARPRHHPLLHRLPAQLRRHGSARRRPACPSRAASRWPAGSGSSWSKLCLPSSSASPSSSCCPTAPPTRPGSPSPNVRPSSPAYH